MAQKIFWLAAAGACGTLARYALGGAVYKWFGTSFPWGTIAVNVLGCFLFGLVWSVSRHGMISPEIRTIVLVGFMGAFTTFSTFVFETSQLLTDDELLMALANVAVQVITGIGVFYLGLVAGRVI